jgi:hypothetical protein
MAKEAPSEMEPSELVRLAEAVWGANWKKPLARHLGKTDAKGRPDARLLRFWVLGERKIPAEVAAELRSFAMLGPAGVIIRDAVKKVMPSTKPLNAHRVAQQAMSDLENAGLFDQPCRRRG